MRASLEVKHGRANSPEKRREIAQTAAAVGWEKLSNPTLTLP